MPLSDFPSRLELSITHPHALSRDVHKAAADAMRLRLAALVVAPAWIARVATMIRGSGLRLITPISHPHGTAKPTLKAIEATSTLKDGADTIDITPFAPNLLTNDFDAARAELLEIVRAARSTRRDARISITLDPAIPLTPALIDCLTRATLQSGCDAITAPSQAIPLLKPHAEGLLLTAAADHLTPEHARSLSAAGADFLRTANAADLLAAPAAPA